MKHEAEQELIKTLTGQIKEIPTVAKTMVQQYQTSATVLSALCVVGIIIALIIAAVFMKLALSNKDNEEWCENYACVSFGSAFFGLALLVPLVINLTHALSPITSIVNEVF